MKWFHNVKISIPKAESISSTAFIWIDGGNNIPKNFDLNSEDEDTVEEYLRLIEEYKRDTESNDIEDDLIDFAFAKIAAIMNAVVI